MEEQTETNTPPPAVDNDPQAMSPEQLREVQAAQLAQAQRLQRVQQADGTYRYEAPFNASRGQRVAAARANANRGMMAREDYRTLIMDIALTRSSAYDGNNDDLISDNVFREVWFEGAQSVLGYAEDNKTEAKREVNDLIRYVMERSGAAPQAVKSDQTRISEIVQQTDEALRLSQRNAYGRLMQTVYAGGNISASAAQNSADLYNLYHGRRFRNGRLTQVPALRDEYLATLEEKPDSTEFSEHAVDFAAWMYERAQRENKLYTERWRHIATMEIMRRLYNARGEELSFNDEQRIINAVLQGVDGQQPGTYDDPHQWPSYLSQEEDDASRYLVAGCYAARNPRDAEFIDRAVEESTAPIDLARQNAARANAEKKSKSDRREETPEEQAARAEEKRRRDRAIRQQAVYREATMWSTDGGHNKEQRPLVIISQSRLNTLIQKYDLQEGDRLVVDIPQGDKTYRFEVQTSKGYTPRRGTSSGIFLNDAALVAMGSPAECDRINSTVTYSVVPPTDKNE